MARTKKAATKTTVKTASVSETPAKSVVTASEEKAVKAETPKTDDAKASVETKAAEKTAEVKPAAEKPVEEKTAEVKSAEEKTTAVKSEEYYVNMMIAWYLATALAKQWDLTIPYLEEKRLPEWVHKKTIQKAIESYRITPEQKAYLRSLR